MLAPAALGAWSAGAAGTAAAGAATAPAGGLPLALVSGASVSVSWGGATIAGAPVAGYVVRRYSTTSGALSSVGGTCSGTVTTTSCSDTSVAPGSWTYGVTPVQRSWTGREGMHSLPVVVAVL